MTTARRRAGGAAVFAAGAGRDARGLGSGVRSDGECRAASVGWGDDER